MRQTYGFYKCPLSVHCSVHQVSIKCPLSVHCIHHFFSIHTCQPTHVTPESVFTTHTRQVKTVLPSFFLTTSTMSSLGVPASLRPTIRPLAKGLRRAYEGGIVRRVYAAGAVMDESLSQLKIQQALPVEAAKTATM